ncbi:hypothetical protein ACLOJK_015502 [Asimina triloba]
MVSMADEGNEGEETSSRGQDWEVVSLTASAYEAVHGPSPKPSDLTDDDNNKLPSNDEEFTSAMFMSGHFVFPPSQHENLPLAPDNSEIHNEPGSEETMESAQAVGLGVEEGERPAKAGEETWNIKGLSEADELHEIQFFDGKGKSFSGHSKEFEEGRALKELNFIEEEQSIFSASKYGSFHAEAELSGSAACDETHITSDVDDPARPTLGASEPSKPQATKEDKGNESDPPCDAWWKRRAAALYSHAKETNTFWSVVVAAALMGLVILGQRWQQERWQIQQLKWKFGVADEALLVAIVWGEKSESIWDWSHGIGCPDLNVVDCQATAKVVTGILWGNDLSLNLDVLEPAWYIQGGKGREGAKHGNFASCDLVSLSVNRIVGPVSRFKDILVGGHRRVTRSSAAAAEH